MNEMREQRQCSSALCKDTGEARIAVNHEPFFAKRYERIHWLNVGGGLYELSYSCSELIEKHIAMYFASHLASLMLHECSWLVCLSSLSSVHVMTIFISRVVMPRHALELLSCVPYFVRTRIKN